MQGGGGKANGPLRESGFDITAASEVMAILALATSRQDLRERLGRIVLAQDEDGQPVTAEAIGAAGMMAVLLKDAIMPNLLQTLEGTPAIVHAGPFGNIAHGNSSILADRIGIKLGEYLVTEAGFGPTLGGEKFCNIKATSVLAPRRGRAGGDHQGAEGAQRALPRDRRADAASGRADRRGPRGAARRDAEPDQADRECAPAWHPGRGGGQPLPERQRRGTGNRARGGAGSRGAGGSRGRCLRRGRRGRRSPGGGGGAGNGGGPDPTSSTRSTSRSRRRSRPSRRRFTARRAWSTAPVAEKAIRDYTRMGFDKPPICMAKTHLSLSDDPTYRGHPTDFTLTIRDIRASVGAGFLYPIAGQMMTLPGLSASPGGLKVDIDANGKVIGLN